MPDELKNLTPAERALLERAKASEFTPGTHGFDRCGDGCNCCWSSRAHGDTCPEHGTPACRDVTVNTHTLNKLLADLDAARGAIKTVWEDPKINWGDGIGIAIMMEYARKARAAALAAKGTVQP